MSSKLKFLKNQFISRNSKHMNLKAFFSVLEIEPTLSVEISMKILGSKRRLMNFYGCFLFLTEYAKLPDL